MRVQRPGQMAGSEPLVPEGTIAELEAEIRKDLPEYDNAFGRFEKLLEQSTAQFAGLLEDANSQLKASVAEAKQQMEQQLIESQQKIDKEAEGPKADPPESAWVKDHLVLNKPAVELFNSMFEQFQAVLQELMKKE